MDARLALAREWNMNATRSKETAARARRERDYLIRQLHEENPTKYTYTQLAKHVGVSKELVAYICHGREQREARARRLASPEG